MAHVNGITAVLHPECRSELRELMANGLRYHHAVLSFCALLDELFVQPAAHEDPGENWYELPPAEPADANAGHLRCLDADGLITVIVSWQDDKLYLLSAAKATRKARHAAVKQAVDRSSDLSWSEED